MVRFIFQLSILYRSDLKTCVKISCECLIIKAKRFWRFIAVVMDREKDDVLRINDLQIN